MPRAPSAGATGKACRRSRSSRTARRGWRRRCRASSGRPAFGAEGRVARILKAKGPAGVFAEIALIEGSWAKRVYFTELLNSPGLDAGTVRQALEQAGREIESDFELASLLIASDRCSSTRPRGAPTSRPRPASNRTTRCGARTRPRSSGGRCRPTCSRACSRRAPASSRTTSRRSSSCRSRGSSRSTPARGAPSSRRWPRSTATTSAAAW